MDSFSPLKTKGKIGRGYNIGKTVSNANVKVGIGKDSSKYIRDSYKLLLYFFKSMYGLISKPVYKFTSEKVIIQLFYYLNIPKKKVLKLFAIYYIKSFKKLWFLKRSQHNTFRKDIFNKNSLNKFGKPKRFFVRWKLKKAISRLKSKKTNIKLLFFNLRKFNLSKVFYSKFKLICDILSNKFKKPVQLELTRLHYPYYDSNILVNLLYLNIKNKRKKSRIAIQKIYNKKAVKKLNDPNLKSINNIPAFLSGLNIKIAGRLMREPMIPRLTTKIYENGATATGKVNYLDIATITKKNRKGAYTIKITSGQNFF
uniref:Small ribosomal subunit protein uS3m n=1 Tax=Cyclocybe aegerita TaxID=1973307 RepID=A0A884P6H9_CYCAE|nr:ribosomal protein S3 [Cyclocybe aegerita]QQP21441.1 ribosomal protein S3 [Cyclocybe aegerita]